MIAEAIDLLDESIALHALLAPLDDDALAAPTAFKQWTPNDIVAHLHFFNALADLSLTDEDAFTRRYAQMAALRGQGLSMREATDRLLNGLSGRALIDRWRAFLSPMAARWHAADPRQRVRWVGPSMSARSSISARLMETWAHGQAIYDRLGVERVDTDRIESIAVMGVNTFGWTFRNRGLDVPAWRPLVRLTLPGGAIREWAAQAIEVDGDGHAQRAGGVHNRIEGAATAFCQVVTQVRHRADVDLAVEGTIASRWMSIAQCFAGPPEDPPAPGSRMPVLSGQAAR